MTTDLLAGDRMAAEEATKKEVMLLTGRMDEATIRFYEGAGFDPSSKQASFRETKPQASLNQ